MNMSHFHVNKVINAPEPEIYGLKCIAKALTQALRDMKHKDDAYYLRLSNYVINKLTAERNKFLELAELGVISDKMVALLTSDLDSYLVKCNAIIAERATNCQQKEKAK
jgi:hypothetical protein